jgi:hypothetical protein
VGKPSPKIFRQNTRNAIKAKAMPSTSDPRAPNTKVPGHARSRSSNNSSASSMATEVYTRQ